MENKNEFLKDLAALVACRSALAPAEEGAPFGRGARRALDLFLGIAEKAGFATKNYDGYLGEVIWGEGEEFGIIGHLDVVPEGSGWSVDPYALTEKDGKIFGRGVVDDKAPLLICLYALAALKREGIVPRRKFRLFAGCNEEAGWEDVAHFVATGGKFPKWGFSPDGNFPVSYAEKGPNAVTFRFPYGGKFTEICGGTVVNAVCARVEAKGPIDEKLLSAHGLVAENGRIISVGKAAHGSRPELGKNAILPLLKYMRDLGEDVGDIIKYLFDDALGITAIGNETGHATLSPDIISLENGALTLIADFRVPAKMKAEDFLPLFDKTGFDYDIEIKRASQYVPEDSPTVQALLAAYNAVTGERAAPVSLGGATFASVFECGVAFGPEFEGRKTAIHEPDEHMLASDPDDFYAIYYRAIKAIATEEAI